VTVEVTGVESPTKGGTTFGVVAVCANTTSCALEQIVAAATRIATIKRRMISSVTGCRIAEALRASHIKPWRESSNKERLDPHNGLLVAAHLDALFDAGLISFNDTGGMLVSDRIFEADRQKLGLKGHLGKPLSDSLRQYLSYHRRYVAQGIEN
jgi:hypothetical protein